MTAPGRLRDPGDPRGPGAGPGHRGSRAADLPAVHLRAGRRWASRAAATSTPGAATRPGPRWRRAWPRWSRRTPAASPSPAGWPPRTPAAALCSTRATTCSSRTTPTAARTGCSPRCWRAGGSSTRGRRPHDLDAGRAARSRPGRTRLVWVETPTNPLLRIVDIAALAEPRPRGGALLVGRQHVRRRPTCSSRSRWAPTWWCTRPRSTWAATPTWSAALRGRRRRELAERLGVPPERHRRGRRPVRLLAGAARGQDAGGADGPALRQRRRRRRRCSTHPRGGRRCSTRACPTTRATRSPPQQMRGFGGMVSFLLAGGRGGRAAVCGRDPAVHAGRVARRGRVADRAPGRMTHASVGRLRRSRSRRPGAAVGRHRGRRRPARGPAPGAERRLTDGGRKAKRPRP